MRRYYIRGKLGCLNEVDESYYSTIIKDLGLDTELLPKTFIHPSKQMSGFFVDIDEREKPKKVEKTSAVKVAFNKQDKYIVLQFPTPTGELILNIDSAKTLISLISGSIKEVEK